MNSTEIIEALRQKLAVTSGRHLYGVLGSYAKLDAFAEKLRQAKTQDGAPFLNPINVNCGILEALPDAIPDDPSDSNAPDDKFRRLADNEAKYPAPTAAHVGRAFERFLRSILKGVRVVVLANLEMLFAYNVDLSLLRTMATDENKVLLLLPGRRTSGTIIMFHEMKGSAYTLPTNLIAENHLWEIRE